MMKRHDLITMGPFQFPGWLIALAVAFALSYALLSIILKRKWGNNAKEEITSAVIGVIVAGFILYHIWPLFGNWSMILNPSQLLFTSGGPLAKEAAVLLGAIVLGLIWKKKKWSLHAADDISLSVFLGYSLYSMILIQPGLSTGGSWGLMYDGNFHHPLHVYEGTLGLVFLWFGANWVTSKQPFIFTLYLAFSVVAIELLLKPVSP
ncbi:hypothetical protein [Bacillus sp. FJAT-44742]|uniref:hypothetical protein n=1 Tax=Bacillus sp. FJAT-44742 TaxID=2014005 RepID=UPI000C24E3E9|nr:hypothetical protein [Bacillus sp. FJAT-44742]